MIEEYAKTLCDLKRRFSQTYSGTSHIQEILPLNSTKEFPFPQTDLDLLHAFAQKNPIYTNSYNQELNGVPCVVYEGDINEYWLNSIKHGSSCQPFYPTWILSAYIMALNAKNLGFTELVDIGSGDGRIAYCGKILDMNAHGIEIDDVLVDLQKTVVSATGIDFDPCCADALEFDYSSFGLTSPVFFIGGLPQMGGDMLATSIIEKINSIPNIKKSTCVVFAGSHSKKHLAGNQKSGGWSTLIEKHNLHELKTISLPTVWTLDQDIDTPYLYTKFS